MYKWTRHQKTLAFTALVLFSIFVWPSLWEYDKAGTVSIRTERITGEVQRLTYSGWYTEDNGWMWHRLHKPLPSMQPTSLPPPPIDVQFSEEETKDVQGTLVIANNQLIVSLYNGSNKQITRLIISLQIMKNGKPQGPLRFYLMNPSSGDATGKPLSDSVYTANYNSYLQPDETYQWQPVIVKGFVALKP